MTTLREKKNKVLFIKPPDRFLENEFVYQQLGPHYLQRYLEQYDILSDILILYESERIRKERETGEDSQLALEHLSMLLVKADESSTDGPFDPTIFENYNIVGMSVMSPQAPDAYILNKLINTQYSHITTVIGGSHPRYYQNSVEALPEHVAFDFIVPQDGWKPMYQIASGHIKKNSKSFVLIDNFTKLANIPEPSRPIDLMKRYNFEIAGVPAYHTITALGCPFSCNFCESATEKLRKFSEDIIDKDLKVMTEVHTTLEHEKKAVMFFDDVALINPKQVERLASLVKKHRYTTWRVFTHAYLVIRYKERLLGPFKDSGGKRIGIGLETGSQRSLDLINKRNGQKQHISEHYEAIKIANDFGIAVDAFTMIYPWEDEQDLRDTTTMLEFIVNNPVQGNDEKGRPMKNHVDSTIMTPFQGTEFHNMIRSKKLNGIELKNDLDPGLLYFKGRKGESGWPYLKTKLPKERYLEEQAYRNSLRPEYR